MRLKEGELNKVNPLTFDQFDNIMKSLDIGDCKKIAVAVSGGGDSMALSLLLNDWCAAEKRKLVALTVDHGLRSSSANEAKLVHDWMQERQIDHIILNWDGKKPDNDIQNEARKARYLLMGKWCVENDIKFLFVAHHQEDQAETFLIRLFRGSGVDGLSSMEQKALFPNDNFNHVYPVICRPLLDIPKQRLIDTLHVFNQDWVNDPSNDNDDFSRIKIRKLLQSSNIEGLNSDRLSLTAKRIRRVRTLLESMTVKAESDYVKYYDLGYAILNVDFIKDTHEEISLRLLSVILKKISGGSYAPRMAKLESLYENLKDCNFQGQTIYGAIVFPLSGNEVAFVREVNSIMNNYFITDEKHYLWDNRFFVNFEKKTEHIRKLDTRDVNLISEKFPDFKEHLKEYFNNGVLKNRVLASLPCLEKKDGTISLPDILVNGIGMQELDSFSVILKK